MLILFFFVRLVLNVLQVRRRFYLKYFLKPHHQILQTQKQLAQTKQHQNYFYKHQKLFSRNLSSQIFRLQFLTILFLRLFHQSILKLQKFLFDRLKIHFLHLPKLFPNHQHDLYFVLYFFQIKSNQFRQSKLHQILN